MRGVETNRESFWLQYYSGSISGDTALEEAPSPFAIEVNAKLVPNRTLLEIGCGNGRDSCLFASNKLTVCATDICKAGVEITKRKLPAIGQPRCEAQSVLWTYISHGPLREQNRGCPKNIPKI